MAQPAGGVLLGLRRREGSRLALSQTERACRVSSVPGRVGALRVTQMRATLSAPLRPGALVVTWAWRAHGLEATTCRKGLRCPGRLTEPGGDVTSPELLPHGGLLPGQTSHELWGQSQSTQRRLLACV